MYVLEMWDRKIDEIAIAYTVLMNYFKNDSKFVVYHHCFAFLEYTLIILCTINVLF